MERVFLAWIGWSDLNAPNYPNNSNECGPIARIVRNRSFDTIVLLVGFAKESDTQRAGAYIDWIKTQTEADIVPIHTDITSPTDWDKIYHAAKNACAQFSKDNSLHFGISSGTPTMTAIWVLLAKTIYPAELIEASKQEQVLTITVPFDIAADYLPDLSRERDERLTRQADAKSPEDVHFRDIIYRCDEMKRVVLRARRVAKRNVPILIVGPSGTGKELFAKAIHRSSNRSEKPFKSINCGAIPASLIESELFGHERGAFTGADKKRLGLFEQANGGTLFLDEVGELPLEAQVKLLRVLQEHTITRIGSTEETNVNVRIIAATNRNVLEEVAEKRFREDLFYRIAVGVLKLPPLRERDGDIALLIDKLLEKENTENAKIEPGYRKKKLAEDARQLLLHHPWPGNVRELRNTLARIVIWTDGTVIQKSDVRDALFYMPSSQERDILYREFDEGFELKQLFSEVAQHYIQRAMKQTNGNKTQAAKLLGISNYQTLTNWIIQHNVKV